MSHAEEVPALPRYAKVARVLFWIGLALTYPVLVVRVLFEVPILDTPPWPFVSAMVIISALIAWFVYHRAERRTRRITSEHRRGDA